MGILHANCQKRYSETIGYSKLCIRIGYNHIKCLKKLNSGIFTRKRTAGIFTRNRRPGNLLELTGFKNCMVQKLKIESGSLKNC